MSKEKQPLRDFCLTPTGIYLFFVTKAVMSVFFWLKRNKKDVNERNKRELKELMEKIPLHDFALKTRGGGKWIVLPVFMKEDLSNSKLEAFPVVIGKSFKERDVLKESPIWDYYIFVGFGFRGTDNVSFLGYLSKKDLAPDKLGKTNVNVGVLLDGELCTEISGWEFKLRDLRPLSEIEHLLTLEITGPPLP